MKKIDTRWSASTTLILRHLCLAAQFGNADARRALVAAGVCAELHWSWIWHTSLHSILRDLRPHSVHSRFEAFVATDPGGLNRRLFARLWPNCPSSIISLRSLRTIPANDPPYTTPSGMTPLLFALYNWHASAALSLLILGADPCVALHDDSQGCTYTAMGLARGNMTLECLLRELDPEINFREVAAPARQWSSHRRTSAGVLNDPVKLCYGILDEEQDLPSVLVKVNATNERARELGLHAPAEDVSSVLSLVTWFLDENNEIG